MSNYKIHQFYDSDSNPLSEAPKSLDYVRGLDVRLHPVFTWNRGRIVRIEWHSDFSLDGDGEEVGTNLVVSEDFLYTEDEAGLARSRTQTITWYREDGSAGDTKTRSKIYGNAAARTEGRRRRRNVIDHMSIRVVGMFAATEVVDLATAIASTQPYIEGLAAEVNHYIEDGSSSLSAAITADAVTLWLSNVIDPGPPPVTIKAFILGELA